MKKLLLATTAALFAALSPAAAANITVTGYALPDSSAFGAGTIDGYNYYDGPITLHVAGGPDILVYCVDLNHELQSGSVYTYSTLTQNGLGNPVNPALSNRIEQIAQIGFAAFKSNDGAMAAAAQLAIWSIEYNNLPVTNFANSTIHNDFDYLVGKVFTNTGVLATTIVPVGNWPTDRTLSQQMLVAVPEAGTWAMMLLGFAGLGFMGYRRKSTPNFRIA